MAAAIVAHVDDESVAIELDQKQTMELRISPGSHVGNVNVTASAAASLVNPCAIAFDPLAVANESVVAGRLHHDIASGAAR